MNGIVIIVIVRDGTEIEQNKTNLSHIEENQPVHSQGETNIPVGRILAEQ
jgi:hypothetical protein